MKVREGYVKIVVLPGAIVRNLITVRKSDMLE